MWKAFELKKIIDETNFNFNQVANLFFNLKMGYRDQKWSID